MRAIQTAAAILAVGAIHGCIPMCDIGDNKKHAPIRKGAICGRDFGKPARQIQVRNAPCLCGSGKKAKRCCVYVPEKKE